MTFSKPDPYSLGKNIGDYRQLSKAIIRMLLFFGHIIQVGERHYQRTYKKSPAIGFDAFQYATELSPTSSVQSITVTSILLKSSMLQKNPLDKKRASVREEKRLE
jgi:hypothetical protein